ncbi:MAG: hypothetical protein GTO67_01315 [Gammaproteobacteria bacterium]|nr:hypothetical protein [Gammaproteobacteria bacterium]NIM73722.1 hypothetical protein [Gammaproteobacteria bacterium]NIN37396.1 hypothetical protein [Gammaproteobacteria bacterium]NIO25555.1 hypothetical protein [Gammaproteobacteria bacterium]NIO66230.1 hypothetical protein [Gammaproteobacteria bacterium]
MNFLGTGAGAFVALVLFALPCAADQSGERAGTLSGSELVGALQGGGYNVYFRHAATDWSQHDDVRRSGDWTSCDPARIRQLSDEGRASAEAVGEAMRALGIPVGRVLASPYCRTVETARLMALGEVETTTDIMNLRVAEYFGGREAIAERARARFAARSMPGTNTILVAHGNVIRLATGVYPGEGECAVFRPLDGGGFEYVGGLRPEEWTRLAERLTGKAVAAP